MTGGSRILATAPPFTKSEVLPWSSKTLLTRRRWALTLAILGGVSLCMIMIALRFGAEDLAMAEIVRIFSQTLLKPQGAESLEVSQVILLQVRLPRVLLGYLVGSCLAAVGVALQALLRNPLADPYVLGISSGAALGAAIATLSGISTTLLAIHARPLCAMIGGLVSVAIVYRIAVFHGHIAIHTLLLAGVILNAIFSALIMFITSLMEPNQSFGMMQWLMGSLSVPSYDALVALAAYLMIGGLILFWQARPLNLLTLGDEAARSTGVEVERVKKTVFVSSALLTGAVVSLSGMIGFVGMIIPHAVRMIIGPDHRLLLPAAALVGGSYLLAADALARTLLAPAEIPVGIITALAGGPFFIYLLVNRRSGVVS